jgi:hypothetical protein
VSTVVPRLSRLLFSRPGRRDEILPVPIRGEPLGAERLADRARALAAGQRTSTGAAPRRPLLLLRLRETRRILGDAHARLTTAAAANVDVGPAGEWLLDIDAKDDAATVADVVVAWLAEQGDVLTPSEYEQVAT